MALRHSNFIALSILIFFSLWLRLPTISDGMPYFEREDEAHHFNRTVRMVQSGDFNPHYFHKPSLHFYLRMPVVAFGFLSAVRKGEIRKVKEIRTKDAFGIGGYAFSASHPGIVKWNRAFSVLLHLATLAVVYGLCMATGLSSGLSFFCTLLFIFSRTGLENSTIIGVDVVVTFFAALTGLLSVISAKTRSVKMLALTALVAGLTVSSKYNALPIVLLPCVSLFYFRSGKAFATLLLVPLGFFIGSPYIFSELPLFLDHFAYEIWHYGIAGHDGHQAEPGVEQAFFYLNWLLRDGFGPLGGVLTLVGFVAAFTKKGTYRLLVVLFPFTFLLLMISQRANFTRNMLVVLPYLALFPGYFLSALSETCIPFRKFIPPLLVVGTLFTLTVTGLSYRSSLVEKLDSRHVFEDWSRANINDESDMGCAGELWLCPQLTKQLRCGTFSAETDTSTDLVQGGFSTLVVPSILEGRFTTDGFFTASKRFPGVLADERIVSNPAISILSVNREKLPRLIFFEKFNTEKLDSLTLRPISGTHVPQEENSAPCDVGDHRSGDEAYCWLVKRFTLLDTSGLLRGTELHFSSPWKSNRVTLMTPNEKVVAEFELSPSVKGFFPLASYSEDKLVVFTEKVRSPAELGISKDTRRLGVLIVPR